MQLRIHLAIAILIFSIGCAPEPPLKPGFVGMTIHNRAVLAQLASAMESESIYFYSYETNQTMRIAFRWPDTEIVDQLLPKLVFRNSPLAGHMEYCTESEKATQTVIRSLARDGTRSSVTSNGIRHCVNWTKYYYSHGEDLNPKLSQIREHQNEIEKDL